MKPDGPVDGDAGPSADYSLPCSDCGKHRFLLRGRCRACVPRLFEEYERRARLLSGAEDAYTRETGKRALEDWNHFERWILRRASARFITFRDFLLDDMQKEGTR